MCPQATSSRQRSKSIVLDAREIPTAAPTVAFWDVGANSDAIASKSTTVMVRSQAEISSIRRWIEKTQDANSAMKAAQAQVLLLYWLSTLVVSQVRATQKPQHMGGKR